MDDENYKKKKDDSVPKAETKKKSDGTNQRRKNEMGRERLIVDKTGTEDKLTAEVRGKCY